MRFFLFIITGLMMFGFSADRTKYDIHALYERNDYHLLYCEEQEQAVYVRYVVNKADVFGVVVRKNNFKEDSKIQTGSASLMDYRKSGYDRGHLKPAAVSKGTNQDMEESFLMSNISPQLPEFNRIGWKGIEAEVRRLLETQDSIVVYTGPVLQGVELFIGENKVGVPKYFYKAVLLGDSSKAYAYLCPHSKLNKPYTQYLVSIDSVEQVIGEDLFPGLDERLEQ